MKNIAISLCVIGLIAVIYLPREMNMRLGDPKVRARFTKNGLIGAYIYYWLGIICSAFMAIFCAYHLWKGV